MKIQYRHGPNGNLSTVITLTPATPRQQRIWWNIAALQSTRRMAPPRYTAWWQGVLSSWRVPHPRTAPWPAKPLLRALWLLRAPLAPNARKG